MASVLPNIIDWARQVDPDGTPAVVAEMLSQCNEILSDMIYQEANGPDYHKVSMRIGLPQGTWRQLNQGVAASKSLYEQTQFAMGELVAYGQVDKTIADLQGDTQKYRMTQDMGTIEGLSQQMSSALFYSNEAVTPTQFTGFSAIYSTVSTATAQIARNVIDMGGTGSANASLWLIGWNDYATYGIFPKGSPAGLQYKDWGDIRALYDASQNPFEGYTSVFYWKNGLAVEDWRYNVRLCNIDTTSAGLAGVAPPDLYAAMSKAMVRPPKMTKRTSGITMTDAPQDPVQGSNYAFYCNRTIREYLDIQAIRDKNVLLTPTEYAGQPIVEFRGIPIRVVDSLTSSEARVV